MPNHNTSPPISPLVPTELVVQVLVDQITESEAIERGRRAARAGTEEERRAILFPVPESRKSPMLSPAQRPWRPCGSPPWGEP